MSIDLVDGSHDAILEFLFGSDADVAQDGAGELGEEALDEVEPRAVLGCERELEAAGRLIREPGLCLPGDVCGMIVEDQLDRGVSRIGSIEKLEKLNELAAAMAILDQGVNFASEQINPGQQAERAAAHGPAVRGLRGFARRRNYQHDPLSTGLRGRGPRGHHRGFDVRHTYGDGSHHLKCA